MKEEPAFRARNTSKQLIGRTSPSEASPSSNSFSRETELAAALAEIARLVQANDAARAAHQIELRNVRTTFEVRLQEERAKFDEVTLQCATKTRIIRQQMMVVDQLQRDLSTCRQHSCYSKQRLQDVLDSTSWRVTAPLRLAATTFRLAINKRSLGRGR